MKNIHLSCSGSLRWLLLFLYLFLSVLGIRAEDGYKRQSHLDIKHYDFFIALEDDSNQVRGECTVSLRSVGQAGGPVELDLVKVDADGFGMKVKDVFQGERPLNFEHRQNRLIISPNWEDTIEGEFKLKVSYSGTPRDGLIISKTKHGKRSFFADNWPDRARHWLPVIDHPYDKAACRFRVEAPSHYQVVAVGDLVEECDLPNQRRLTVYEEPAFLPTKVMVIAVAQFAVAHLPALRDIQLESWVYPEDREAGFARFTVVSDIIRFYEGLIGPFAFAKIASVQSKTRFGGMENAGAVFYNEGVVRMTPGTETLIAHEMAHQWFGDGVSEADWHHIWLSEGFATYLTSVYSGHRFGAEAMRDSLLRARQRVVGDAVKNPDGRVIDPRVGMDGLLSTLTYQKGAWALHMLRQLLGEVTFWTCLKTFYQRFNGRSALTSDLLLAMEEQSGQKLGWFFDQWLKNPGFPVLKVSWRPEGVLCIEQVQKWPHYYTFDLDVDVVHSESDRPLRQCVHITGPKTDIPLLLEKAPKRLVMDPDVKLLFAEPGWESLTDTQK